MLYPPMNELLENVGSRYLMVNVVARRARQIAMEVEEMNEQLDDKPVTLAINEIYEGRLTASLKPELENARINDND